MEAKTVKVNVGGREISVPEMRYPQDIVVYKTSQKTFSVTNCLAKRELDEDSPMMIHSKFSRFKITIISDGKAISSNIRPEEVSEIAETARMAFKLCMEKKLKQDVPTETPASSSKAFTVRFFSGKLKGKTPAEVLAEDPENSKKVLNEQYTWLKENLQKYPKNKELMDAIVEASKLSQEDLKACAASAPQGIATELFNSGDRPLRRKKREDGLSPVYGTSVQFDSSKNYPITVSVRNFYAPVMENENGTLNVQYSKKQDEKVYSFAMTASQWLDCTRTMEQQLDQFERMYFADAYRIANAYSTVVATEASKNAQPQA